MPQLSQSSIVKTIFFGNYFYGLCVILLAMESMFQLNFPLNDALFFILLFLGTVVYYTKAYVTSNTVAHYNFRSQWYHDNKKVIQKSQTLFITSCLLISVFLFIKHRSVLNEITLLEIIILGVFPLVAFLYYGLDNNFFAQYKLRNIGWLKPFIIGFVWSGIVSIYPILYYSITHHIPYTITMDNLLLFAQNFMFITVLCIMFDIKDYAADNNRQLKTFVVRVGLRQTIFAIIIPLTIIGFIFSILQARQYHFSMNRMILSSLIFPLLVTVAYSLYKRKSILFYLIIIDGLLLIKAVCGILGKLYF
jgi:hypothetical protein